MDMRRRLSQPGGRARRRRDADLTFRRAVIVRPTWNEKDVEFVVVADTCAAWLYPAAAEAGTAPVVVTAHGRWRAAIACARSLPGIDPARVAAFGSSMGGGNALAAGVDDPAIPAAVSQVPFLDP
jgi:poly(3-hydroxybutyrate) depolymerase